MTPLLLQIDPHQHLWNSYLKPQLPAAGFQLNTTLDHKLYRNHSTAQNNDDDWLKADEYLAQNVIPLYLSASLIEEKNKILCEGIYEYFSSKNMEHKTGKELIEKKV